MKWHGAAVFYAPTEEENRKELNKTEKLQELRAKWKGKRTCKKSVNVDGTKRKFGDLKLFFVDTVVENTNMKDTMTTDSIIDSLCVRIKGEIPTLEVIIVSDNAPKYVNLTILLICF